VLDYLYDFGDDWEHQVSVETVTAADPAARYPRRTGGQGVCPPEDCGAIPGYQRLSDVLAGPLPPSAKSCSSGSAWPTLPTSTRLGSTPTTPTPDSPRSPGSPA